MQHRFIPLALLSLALAWAFPMGAQDKVPPKARDKGPKAPQASKPEAKNPYVERFEQLDRDKDGYVSLAEWPLAPESFQVVDRNRDGRLSREELLTPNVLRYVPPQVEFRRLDTNRDGRLERREWQLSPYGLGPWDRNKDGLITRPEFNTGLRIGENTWSPGVTPREEFRFRNLDRNHDSRINQLEWTGSIVVFNRLDLNRDGNITPNEWR